jgi:hypothetical protein
MIKDHLIGQGNYCAGTSGCAPNSYDLRQEYGPASIDLTHRFLASSSYESPFGKGKRLFNQGGMTERQAGGATFEQLDLLAPVSTIVYRDATPTSTSAPLHAFASTTPRASVSA